MPDTIWRSIVVDDLRQDCGRGGQARGRVTSELLWVGSLEFGRNSSPEIVYPQSLY
jgi:hypothetical protein